MLDDMDKIDLKTSLTLTLLWISGYMVWKMATYRDVARCVSWVQLPTFKFFALDEPRWAALLLMHSLSHHPY